MPIRYANPKEVGADRIANAVGAYDLYGGPCVVVDLGTATTFDAISEDGEYLGGAIAPGVAISLDALYAHAAALRAVELVEPRVVIGQSTEEAIQSGVLYGFAAQVDGMCARFSPRSASRDRRRHRRAAPLIAPYTSAIDARGAVAHAARPAHRLRAQRGHAREGPAAPLRARRLRRRGRRTASAHLAARRGVRRTVVAVAGRVMLVRPQGKLAFAHAPRLDGRGPAVRARGGDRVVRAVREPAHRRLGGRGRRGRAHEGAASCRSRSRRFVVLAETELGFGDKWHGITDPDLRYRHREADLWANPESRIVARPPPRPPALRARAALGGAGSSRSRRRS